MEVTTYLELIGDTDKDEKVVCLIDFSQDACKSLIKKFSNYKYILNTEIDYDEEEFRNLNVSSVSVPDVFTRIDSKTKYIIESCLENEYIEEGEEVYLVYNSDEYNAPIFTKVTATSDKINSEIKKLFFESRPDVGTLQHTLNIATSLAKTGQKGEPIGVLFVIGDEEEVLNRSRPLNYNPFSGADVHISDEVVSASIGEYAKLDGAFVISDNGQIISANRYLEPRVHDAEVPSGLGARHMAASGITKVTDAVAIVVSESDQKVRCFVDGEIVISENPEDISL